LAVRSCWTSAIAFSKTKLRSYDLSQKDIGLLDVSTYYLTPGFVYGHLRCPLTQLTHNRRVWRRLRARLPRIRSSIPLSPSVPSPALD
jgi:hypothetical protein